MFKSLPKCCLTQKKEIQANKFDRNNQNKILRSIRPMRIQVSICSTVLFLWLQRKSRENIQNFEALELAKAKFVTQEFISTQIQ